MNREEMLAELIACTTHEAALELEAFLLYGQSEADNAYAVEVFESLPQEVKDHLDSMEKEWDERVAAEESYIEQGQLPPDVEERLERYAAEEAGYGYLYETVR